VIHYLTIEFDLIWIKTGEALLSPLVQCGPKGLRFLQPVELRIPHDGGSRANSSGRWNVSLKASNELGQWRQIELPQRGNDDHEQRAQSEQLDDAKNSRNHLSVFVDHFWNQKLKTTTPHALFSLLFVALPFSLALFHFSLYLSITKLNKNNNNNGFSMSTTSFKF
jgi:hypothetical protein